MRPAGGRPAMEPAICCGSFSGGGPYHRFSLPRGHLGGPWCQSGLPLLGEWGPAGPHPVPFKFPGKMEPGLPTGRRPPPVDSGVPSPRHQPAHSRTSMGAAECPLAESPLCRPWRGWAGLYPPQGRMSSPEDSAG